mgnify:CR=1 FL=1
MGEVAALCCGLSGLVTHTICKNKSLRSLNVQLCNCILAAPKAIAYKIFGESLTEAIHKVKKKLYQLLIELTNSLPVSKLIMKFAQSKVSRFIVPSYANYFKVDVTEIDQDLKSFKSLQQFFVRNLKPEARIFNNDDTTILSPVDAIVEQFGSITANNNIVVKNQSYSIKGMLGNDKSVSKYIGGSFLVLYLSPSHYHRIHSPINGKIINQYPLGSNSYPVNKLGLTLGNSPLAQNYRVITEMKEKDGSHVAVVKVGAMFVNTIEELAQPSQRLKKGEELAYFSFGSTVVLLFEKGKTKFNSNIKVNQEIKAGEVLVLKI